MDADDARRRFAAARVARFATVGPDGAPHLVPVVFALGDGNGGDGDGGDAGGADGRGGGDTVLMAVDDKPKRHRRLRRMANIEAHPTVSLLADHYDDDWSALWWVRADGVARVHEDPHTLERARALLGERYPQHRANPPDGPVIAVTVTRWSGWTAG